MYCHLRENVGLLLLCCQSIFIFEELKLNRHAVRIPIYGTTPRFQQQAQPNLRNSHLYIVLGELDVVNLITLFHKRRGCKLFMQL